MISPLRGRRSASKVAILYGAVGADAPADEQDVLVEVETVGAALEALGYAPVSVPISLDLESARRHLMHIRPAFVFNLVESIEGQGRLIHMAPALLESLGLPFTGAGADAAYVTSNKPLAKRLMAAGGIPTPAWAEAGRDPEFPGPYIVKSVWEHASIGIDDTSVTNDRARLGPLMRKRERRHGGEWFAEAFVEGREFNLSLLAGPAGVELLPPAEMCFVDYPPGKPRIVNYAAKWDETAFEFHATQRRFDFPAQDSDLLRRLGETAMACWRLFDLKGYARVDCRVNGAGEVRVLEININPCLSPDAGFAAAAARAGLDRAALVRRILGDIGLRLPIRQEPRRELAPPAVASGR